MLRLFCMVQAQWFQAQKKGEDKLRPYVIVLLGLALHCVVLTRDHHSTVEGFALSLHLDQVHAAGSQRGIPS